MATPSLPIELWLTVTDYILANDSHPGRFLDLARLSWTCRSAYQAAHPFLWQRLCLVFRDGHERNLAIGPRGLPYEQDMQRVHLCRHQQVLDSSVFPRYRQGQLDVEGGRLDRIRAVSEEYPGLQPFVVLDGQLYLASLLENESNPSDPDLSGIASLWGNEAAEAVRMEGGLVLFPYPLHWVNELIVDVLASADDCRWEGPELYDTLPFLLSMDPKKVRTFRFYSEVDLYEWDAYHAMTDRYQELACHDYFLPADSRSCPAFGPSTRHVRMLHGFYFDDHELFNQLADLPNLASLEIFGVADVHLDGGRQRLHALFSISKWASGPS